MASNQWIPSGLIADAATIPVDERIEYLVSNALKPIPEHKFDTLYFYLFNQPFRSSLFGPYNNITELIASKPNLYRTISNDGRAFIKYNQNTNILSASSLSLYQHLTPKWCIKADLKKKIYGNKMMLFKVYKDGVYIKNIDLKNSLFSEHNKSFITFGRANNADFSLQHETLSRIHCVFQFSNDGTIYLLDVSTHGTKVNNKCIPKKKYFELRNKDKIYFGHSSRCYVLIIDQLKTNNNNNSSNQHNINLNISDKNQFVANMKINKMQNTIEKLKLNLNKAQKDSNNKSKEIMSLMQKIKVLNVNTNQSKNNNRNNNNNNFYSQILSKIPKNKMIEKKEPEEEDNEEELVDKKPQRIGTIKRINFVKEVNNLSKLTVVKLKYYTNKNNIEIGKRLKKSELIKIIKKDIQKHFDV